MRERANTLTDPEVVIEPSNLIMHEFARYEPFLFDQLLDPGSLGLLTGEDDGLVSRGVLEYVVRLRGAGDG